MIMRRFAIALTFALLLSLFALVCASAEPVNATPLTLNQAATATISQAGGCAYFSFTPTESGTYVFYSVYPAEGEQRDTYGYLYNANMEQLAYDDDGGDDNNFRITYDLTAGTTYYFGARYYSGDVTGAFDVYLKKYAGLVSVSPVGDYERLVQYGASVTLAVETVCTDASVALTYRWSDPDGDIEGATQATCTIPNVTRAGWYWCHVSDEFGNTQSTDFRVKIDNDLTIARVGDSMGDYTRTVAPGGSVTLEATASCRTGALTYQWSGPNGDIEGATATTYTVANANHSNNYWCRVTDQYGNQASVDFYVRIDNNLTVERVGEYERTVAPGGSTTMTVDAHCNAGALTYRWVGPDGDIEGATSATYTVQNITRTGSYRCNVTDQYGSTASTDFNVKIENHLTATTDNGQTDNTIYVELNDTPLLEVFASCDTGANTLHYQWYENIWYNNGGWNVVSIDGATSNTYQAPQINERKNYYCKVWDDYGNNTSVNFYIYIDNGLTVERVGESERTVEFGGSVTLSVDAHCNEGGLTYRWSGPDGDIAGATAATYTVTNATRAGWYYCYVSDQYSSTTNTSFNVKIENHLTAYTNDGHTNSTTLYVNMNDTPLLGVVASCDTGSSTLHYQWHESDVIYDDGGWSDRPIEGANSSTYQAQPVTERKNYLCVVQDDYGNTAWVYFHIFIDNHLTVRNLSAAETTVAPGDSVELSVTASCSTGNITYRWSGPDGDIEGATSATCTVQNITRSGSYWCYVADQYSNTASTSFYVRIDNHLTVQCKGNSSITVAPNEAATLEATVSCDDEDGLTIYWAGPNNSNIVIEGATSASYTVAADAPKGSYWCYAVDKYGNRASAWFNVYQDNELRAERVGEYTRLVQPGGSETLEVEASCKVGTPSYQWYRQGDDEDEKLVGQTAKTLTLNNIQSSDQYFCRVSDQYGSYRDVWFQVKIDTGLYARRSGSYDVRVAMGGSASLTVDAGCNSGFGSISYAWYLEDDDDGNKRIEGANSATLTLNDVQQSGYYFCVASDSYGSSVDVFYHVWVNNFRAFRVGPEYVYARPGDNVTLSVYARCAEGELSFEWRHYDDTEDEFVRVEGAMYNSLTLANLAQGDFGEYKCRVSDEYGNQQSCYFYVERRSTVSVYAETEEDQVAAVGDAVTFQVGVDSSGGNLTYEWRAYPTGDEDDESVVIEGVTGDTYNFTVTADSPRLYRCQVSNSEDDSDSVYFRLLRRSGTVTALTLDEPAQASITVGGDNAFFSFTPAVAGTYAFTSESESDTYGYLYDSNWNLLENNDDGGSDYNFKVTMALEAGETYYLGARYYSSSTTGEFPVTVSAVQGEIPSLTVALSASPANPMIGEVFTLTIEGNSEIYEADLYSVDDEGNWNWMRDWYDEDIEYGANYEMVCDEPQTLKYIAVGHGEAGRVESDLLTVNVTSSGTTLAKPTVSVSADSDSVKIAYTMPAHSDGMRVRVQAGNIRREFWASQSGTLTVPASKLSLGQVNVEVEATAFGAGYLASTTTASGSVFLHSANKMVLPSGLVSIDDEAFAGIPAEEFVIPSGCTTIGARAFADCDSLKLVVMPDSVTNISSSAFDGCEGVVFICQSNNAAANYARQHDNISYIIG